jgi:hypothetical protein
VVHALRTDDVAFRCHFFAVGTGSNHGRCYWEVSTCTEFTPNLYHVYKLTPAYRLRKAGHTCNESRTELATGLGVEECAHLCAETTSCTYFSVGYDGAIGNCFREDSTCAGYSSDTYNTYEVIPLSDESASSSASAYWGGAPSWSSNNINPTTPGWLTIAEERVGSGNQAAFDGDRQHAPCLARLM